MTHPLTQHSWLPSLHWWASRHRDDGVGPEGHPTAAIDGPRCSDQLDHRDRLPLSNPRLPGGGDLDHLRAGFVHRHQLGDVQQFTGLPVGLLPPVVVILGLRGAGDHEFHAALCLDFQLHLAVLLC